MTNAHVAGTVGSILFALALNSTTHAASILFDDETDTIQVAEGTVPTDSMTIEGVVQFSTSLNGYGMLFNEWTHGVEDKQLNVGSGSSTGYFFPSRDVITATQSLSLDGWHHIAHVTDGVIQSLYIDGMLAN